MEETKPIQDYNTLTENIVINRGYMVNLLMKIKREWGFEEAYHCSHIFELGGGWRLRLVDLDSRCELLVAEVYNQDTKTYWKVPLHSNSYGACYYYVESVEQVQPKEVTTVEWAPI